MQSACAILYCPLWFAWLYHIFPPYFINGTIFRKKVIEHKTRVLILPATFVRKIPHSNKN